MEANVFNDYPAYYDGVDHLGRARLIGLESFGDRITDDIFALIKSYGMLTHSMMRPYDFIDVHHAHNAYYYASESRICVGRYELLRQVLQYAQSPDRDAGEPIRNSIFMLSGPVGSGKSNVLAYVEKMLVEGLKIEPNPHTGILRVVSRDLWGKGALSNSKHAGQIQGIENTQGGAMEHGGEDAQRVVSCNAGMLLHSSNVQNLTDAVRVGNGKVILTTTESNDGVTSPYKKNVGGGNGVKLAGNHVRCGASWVYPHVIAMYVGGCKTQKGMRFVLRYMMTRIAAVLKGCSVPSDTSKHKQKVPPEVRWIYSGYVLMCVCVCVCVERV